MTARSRYLTKTRFKLACECPTKLFYAGKAEYADQKINDPFLLALAEGGFQIGELAKAYFPGGIQVTASDDEDVLAQTNKLLENEKVTIFEAAVLFENLFIEIDILIKDNNRLELIEVKSKSYDPAKDAFFSTRGISSSWKKYLYDVAFQKYVTQLAFPDFQVEAFLMLVDKTTSCPTDGLNQKFRIRKETGGRKRVELAASLTKEEQEQWLLRKINVDAECDKIFAGADSKSEELSFAGRVKFFADQYQRDKKIITGISSGCKDCEFRTTTEDEAAGSLSGVKECWTGQLGWEDDDFAFPTVLDIWDFRNKDKFIANGKIKMSSLTPDDIEIKLPDKSGLSRTQRQWLQVEKVCNNDSMYFIDSDNLRAEMQSWKFPLHFIDFETAMPAIPFTKGRRPYEGIAFQFSHHVVYEDGRVVHHGDFLNTEAGMFPNYDLVRSLRNELGIDDGTVFRYAAHENTYLNTIHRQLVEDQTGIPDREELIKFIRSISKSTAKSTDSWEGERCTVDMLAMVKRFYYDPHTNGSNSIKYVLPAILNSSKFLQDKYSKPVYGGEIPSCNFPPGWVWVTFEGGKVVSPYKLLPKMFVDVSDRDLDILSEDDEIREGGAAMTAYARLQFEEMSDYERDEICQALLKYCELDTLAMVMIYEGWREMLG